MQQKVSISKLVHGGQGLGDLQDGRKVFVWNALPGETVEVELTRNKKDYAEGFAINILTPSDDRIKTYSKEDVALSVSPWSFMTYQAEQTHKKEILKETFEREHVSLPDFDFIATENGGDLTHQPTHYRNKVEFSFWGDDNGLHFAQYLRSTHKKIKLNYPS